MKKLLVSFFMLLILIVGLNTVEINAENPINDQFDFNYEIQLGSSEIIEDGFVTPMSVNYGQVVSIDAGSLVEENYEFVGYILNGKVVYNPSIINQGIRVTEDTNITAFFKDINETAVIFTDSNQDYLGIVRYTDEFDKVPYDTENPIPDYTVLSKPGLEPIGWTENGLDTIDFDVDTFTQDTVVAVLYDVASNIDPVNLTVTNGQLATGEPSSGEYEYNQIATVEADTAPQGEYFQYWLKDGNIASLQETYSFTMLADTTVEAVYGLTEDYQADDLFIGLSNPYQIRDNYNSFVGQFFLPDGEEMIEYGVIASESPGEITLDTNNIIKIRSNRYYSETNEFMRSIPDSLSGFIRAYMITTDGTNTTITYSPEYTDWDNNESFLSFPETSSSYENGSFVGINNINWEYINARGDKEIDNETVTLQNNGEAELSGFIANGIDILSIDYSNAFSSPAGVDVYINGVLVGTSSESSDNQVHTFTLNNLQIEGSFTIKFKTTDGQLSLDNFNWMSFGEQKGYDPILEGLSDAQYVEGDNFDPLNGVSASDIEDGDLTSAIDYVVKDNTNTIIDPVDFTTLTDGNYTVEYSVEDSYGNVVTDSINLEVLPLATYTVTFDSNEGSTVNPITDIDINTTISEPDPAPTKTGYVFYSWFNDSDLTNEFDFSTPITEDITLYAGWNKDGYAETTYVETFTGLDYTGGSYADGTFAGDDGTTWTYTGARGDFDLDGQAIMLQGGGTLTALIQGGISSFSADFYDAYSGAAEFELYINGTLVDTSDSVNGLDATTHGTFEVTGINIVGEFTIEIVSSDSQMVLDNLTWTTNTVFGTTHTVSYEENGGSTVDDELVNDGQLATEPTDPTKTDYVFDGWFTDDTTFENEFNFATDTITADITLYAKWSEAVAETTYTENFSTFVGSGTSYITETFTGDSGFDWTVTNSRKSLGGYEINGGGIMFKNGTMTSTITGGISTLSLDILMGFTGGSPSDRTIEIYVNGDLVGTHTLSTTNVETLTINDINVSGEFTLVIENAGGDRQIVINNLTWETYSNPQ